MVSCFTRLPVDDVVSPELKQVLRAWHQIAGSGTRVEFTAIEQDLWRSPVLLGRRSAMLIADEAAPHDPRAWVLARSGGSFPVFGASLPIGQRMADLPDPAYVAAAAPALVEALTAGLPTLHRYSGTIEGRRIRYERVALPMYHRGRPDVLCTVSAGYVIEGTAPGALRRPGFRTIMPGQ